MRRGGCYGPGFVSAGGFSLPETIVQEECHVFRAVMGKNVQEARFGHPYAITVDRSELDSFFSSELRN